MSATKRIPVTIEFEGKIFDHFSDNDGHPQFDTYLLKSKANVIRFEINDDHYVKIYTAKFPTGFWGCGYSVDLRILITGDELNTKCIASGPGGSKSFNTEFEAQVFIINYVLNHCLLTSFSSYHAGLMRKELQNFVNPKALF